MNTCVCVCVGGGMCGEGRYHPAGGQRTSMNTCMGESGICGESGMCVECGIVQLVDSGQV